MRQQALTLVAPIAPGAEQAMDGWLRANRRQLQRALERSTTTHFARWVILLPSHGDDGQAVGARPLLTFETSFDGELEDHVADLRACLGAMLDDSFRGAEGYPGCQELPPLVGFFRAHARRAGLFFAANPGLSVAVVRGDQLLHDAVEARLGELLGRATSASLAPLELARDLQQAARDLAAARGLVLGVVDRPASPDARSVWASALQRPFGLLLALLLAPFFELREELARRRQPPGAERESTARRDAIGREEDHVEQNGFAHLVSLKQGWYRRFAFPALLRVVAALASARTAEGRFLGAEGVHFARWVTLPDRRLLFMSSYDGSWESQVGELIARAARALTAVWTHTVRFPRTRLLLLRGAREERAFKAWMRAHQVPTQVWYSAYPRLSVGAITKNARVRELLGSELSPSSAERLLALL